VPECHSGVHLPAKLPEIGNMRLLHFVLIAITAFLLTCGFQCGDCSTLECGEFLSIRFESEADDSNLFFNGTYQPDSLQVYAVRSDSTTFDYSDWSGLSLNDDDPYFYMTLSMDVESYVFRYNHQESDTLQVRYFLYEEPCCAEKINFTYGIYRGDTVRVERDGYLKLKK